MLKIMILICAINVSHADCQPNTAISVTWGPRVQNEVSCALTAQSMMASTELVHPDEYMKISCVHKAREAAAEETKVAAGTR